MAEVTQIGIAADFISLNKNRKNSKNRVSKEEIEKRRSDARERLKRIVNYDGGKLVMYDDPVSPLYGYIVAGIAIKNKLYIVLFDEHRRLQIRSIADKYKIVYEMPAKLSVADYLIHNQRNDTRELIQSMIDSETTWELVTELGIRYQKPKSDKPKNSSQNKSDKKKRKKQKQKKA